MTRLSGVSWADRDSPPRSDRDWSFADRLGDLISAHAPDGTYRYASAAARDLLGYEPEELVGTSAYDYFHPDDVPKVGIARRGAFGGAAFTVIYRLRRKGDEYIWVETTNRIVSDPETDEVVEILGCTRPVEHRETAEAMDDEERDSCTRRIDKRPRERGDRSRLPADRRTGHGPDDRLRGAVPLSGQPVLRAGSLVRRRLAGRSRHPAGAARRPGSPRLRPCPGCPTR